MTEFTAHEGQDTVIVRGAMHHLAMTESEFAEWLAVEDCNRSKWMTGERDTPTTCLVRRPDGSVRCIAAKLSADLFEVISL